MTRSGSRGSVDHGNAWNQEKPYLGANGRRRRSDSGDFGGQQAGSRHPLWARECPLDRFCPGCGNSAHVALAKGGSQPVGSADTDATDGRFRLRADLPGESANRLFLVSSCTFTGCSGTCVATPLPPLRRDDDRWVVISTGKPLEVTVTITERDWGRCVQNLERAERAE